MDAVEVEISDALAAELNDPARSWHDQFAATRRWLTVYIEATNDLRVAVVPLTEDQGEGGQVSISRAGIDRFDYKIGIDIQQHVDVALGNVRMDELTKLAQDIHDFYRPGEDGPHILTTMPSVQIIQAIRPEIYDLERLAVDHIWETGIELTALIFR